jgi:hypothetical protein
MKSKATLTQEQIRAWRENHEALASATRPESVNVENRTVDVLWLSGADVVRYDWKLDELYWLRFDPKGADLSLLNNGAPVCDSHSCYSVYDQLGVVDKAWEDGGQFYGTLRFSKREDVDGVWQDVADKIVTKFSMGVAILETEDLARKEGEMLHRLATKWQPMEISLVSIPADFNTTTLNRQTPKPAPAPAFLGGLIREVEVLRLRGL